MPPMPATPEPRELTELSTKECWEVLGRRSVGRLAVAISYEPDIFPVNYGVDDATIVVRTAAGLKLAASVLGRAVAFEVDEVDEEQRIGTSVVVRGRAVEIERIEEVVEVERLGLEPWAAGARDRYLRIVPTHISGRRIA